MFIFWFAAMNKWLGFLGSVLAVILAPGLVIFPAVFWIIEGVFPTFYFIVWGIGIVGLIIYGISSKAWWPNMTGSKNSARGIVKRWLP